MFKTALLILTQPLNHIRSALPLYVTEINQHVSKTAYIHIQPGTCRATHDAENNSSSGNTDPRNQKSNFEIIAVPFSAEVRDIVKDCYVSNANSCSNLDIRVLVGHFGNSKGKFTEYNFKDTCDVVLIDQPIADVDKPDFIKSLANTFNVSATALCQTMDVSKQDGEQDGSTGTSKRLKTEDIPALEKTNSVQVINQVPYTVLGGTFDRLHVGHKILLSEGCLYGTDKLTVGVTNGDMNKKKTLLELIQPTDVRISIVEDFLREIKPSMEYNVVPITDGFGPTVTDPDMDLIILSQETKKGGEMINTERGKRGMKLLQEYTIDLVEDACHSQYEEDKISSSSQRKRLLGTLFHPLKAKEGLPKTPYIIGLTGGIASGKSSVCKRLEGQGAKIVDCDKLGHRTYVKGTPGFEKVVTAFGKHIVGDDGEVNRKELGKIVFGSKEELQRLNGIVWPEISSLAEEEIKEYANALHNFRNMMIQLQIILRPHKVTFLNIIRILAAGHTIIVLDAAVLLEAGWDDMCHEVWTTIVPQEEAVKRVIERNKLTEEQAKQRLSSQISNAERVERSNVVLCTLWEFEYTQEQVERAWRQLRHRISSSTDVNP